jgi:hypothetical protein
MTYDEKGGNAHEMCIQRRHPLSMERKGDGMPDATTRTPGKAEMMQQAKAKVITFRLDNRQPEQRCYPKDQFIWKILHLLGESKQSL